MTAAWEEPSMKKLIGFCFLTATLLATSAHAQGIYIDRGDPNAVSAASRTLRDLRIAEVSKLDMKVEGGKVVAYRARVQLSFKYDG